MSSWAETLQTQVNPIPLDAPKVFDLPKFDGYQDPRKLEILSRIAEGSGRDPRLATLAVDIFRQAGVQPRDYKGQAAALLKWVQDNIYYVNEPDERLQEPTYTLRVRYGDCDDCAILLYALCRSVRLPCKFVISGTDRAGRKVRYHQGDKHFPRGVNWAHIYCAIGDVPYGPARFHYAEPTMKVPFGWDVVGANSNAMPEMNAYGDASSNTVDAGVAKTGSATAIVGSGGWNWKEAGATIVIAALSTVAGEIALGWYREWKRKRKERTNPAPRRNRTTARRGKFADVLLERGREGFAIPEKAPKHGSFPLYPIKRARYALTIVASPVYDSDPKTRARVLKAAVEAHPQLAAEAATVRRTVARRKR